MRCRPGSIPGSVAPPQGTLVIGASVNLGGDGVKDFSDSQIDVTWAPATGTNPTDQTNYFVGRFTLDTSVNSTFQMLVALADGNTIFTDGVIVDVAMGFGEIPEPAEP